MRKLCDIMKDKIKLPEWFYDIQYIQSLIDLERDLNCNKDKNKFKKEGVGGAG